MKKQLFLIALVVFAGTFSVKAQGGFQRRTVEERVKSVHEKMDSAFKPEAVKMAAIDSLFSGYYRDQDKMRDEMMASGNTDRDAMRAKFTEMSDARDVKLKAILTEAEMKIWKENIEPSMRPQRRPQQ